jgi:hypothetical protein
MTDRVLTRIAPTIQGLPDCAPGIRAPLAQVRAIGATALAAALLLPGGALAQAAADDAPLAYVDIGTYLRYQDDDPGDEEQAFETRLGLGYFLATAGQRLSFEGALVLQAQEDEEVLSNPSATLSYAAFSRATEVSVDLSYSALDLEDRELDDDFDAGDLTEDGGRRDRITARVGLVTGRTGFFGTVTELSYRDDSFSDGAVEDDETFLSLGTTLRFTLDPRITLRATGFASQEDTDDALNTVETIHSYGLGADLLIDRLWTANIDVGYREIETETGAVTQIVDGTTAAFLLTREMRNGVFSFSATRDITNTGFEDTVRLRRALTLANGAEVDFSLGAVIFEGADPIAIYGASYANEIRPGMRLRLAFDRSGGVTDDDENIIRTRLTTDLAHNLTEASSLVLGADLSQVEEAGLAGTDTTQVDLSLAYRYALTRDWTLAARARHGIVFEDGADTERSTVFSIGVERRFSFRP